MWISLVIDPWALATSHQGLIDAFLKRNMWIVDKSHTLDLEDYWQIGFLALYEAATRFDPEKGKYGSFAYLWVRGGIMEAFRSQAFPVFKVPKFKHNKKGISVDEMNTEQLWFHNALNVRIDLSAIETFPTKHHQDDSENENFKFFD